MKYRIGFACVLATVFIVLSSFCQEPEAISIGGRITIQSKVLTEERDIYIHLPGTYDESNSRHPVLFILDAERHFSFSVGIEDFLSRVGRIPEMIVIGIPNVNRNRDFSFDKEQQGRADDFMKFLEEELIPYVDAHYRTYPYRILNGWSLTGAFSIYVHFSKSGIFNGTIAMSPSFLPLYGHLTGFVGSVLKMREDIPGSLYFTLGDEPTSRENIEGFLDLLRVHLDDKKRWKFQVFDTEDHTSVRLKSLYAGLEYMFDGWRLTSEVFEQGAEAVRNHYRRLSDRFGYDVEIPEQFINQIGYELLFLNREELAIEIFKLNTEEHPGSANVFDSLGEAYERTGRYKEALQNYQKALQKGKESGHPNLDVFQRNLLRIQGILKDRKDQNYGHLFQSGLEAYAGQEFGKAAVLFLRAVELNPQHPTLMYNLAKSLSRSGRVEEALIWLKKAVEAKGSATYAAPEDESFLEIKNRPAFREILRDIEELKRPVGGSKTAFKIPQRDLLPEGLAFDPTHGRLFLGSTYRRKIISIDQAGRITDFVGEKQYGLLCVLGLTVDPERGILWACSNHIESGEDPLLDQESVTDRLSALFAIDLGNGELIRRYRLSDAPHRDHLMNDLVVSFSGDVFVTDSEYGAVYRLPSGGDQLELFFQSDSLHYPNGIALSNNQKILFIAHGSGILRFDLGNNQHEPLANPKGFNWAMIDGLTFHQNTLIAHLLSANRIVRYRLDGHLHEITGMETLEANHPLFGFPTTGDVGGGVYYYIADCQLSKIRADGTLPPISELEETTILKVSLKD